MNNRYATLLDLYDEGVAIVADQYFGGYWNEPLVGHTRACASGVILIGAEKRARPESTAHECKLRAATFLNEHSEAVPSATYLDQMVEHLDALGFMLAKHQIQKRFPNGFGDPERTLPSLLVGWNDIYRLSFAEIRSKLQHALEETNA